jgi:hypothetical protein
MTKRLKKRPEKRAVLIDDWRRGLWRLWSIRVALLWGAVCGLYAALPVFQDHLRPVQFALVSVVMCMAIAGARVLKQPGADT